MANCFLRKSRHGTTFYFRRRVPKDLAPFLGRSQLYLSLETALRADALVKARRLAVHCDELFAALRNMSDKPDFKDTPLGHLIELRKLESPLKEQIEELKQAHVDEVNNALHGRLRADAEFQQLRAADEAKHNARLKQVVEALGSRAVATPALPVGAQVSPPAPQPGVPLAKGVTIAEAIEEMLTTPSKSLRRPKQIPDRAERLREVCRQRYGSSGLLSGQVRQIRSLCQ